MLTPSPPLVGIGDRLRGKTVKSPSPFSRWEMPGDEASQPLDHALSPAPYPSRGGLIMTTSLPVLAEHGVMCSPRDLVPLPLGGEGLGRGEAWRGFPPT